MRLKHRSSPKSCSRPGPPCLLLRPVPGGPCLGEFPLPRALAPSLPANASVPFLAPRHPHQTPVNRTSCSQMPPSAPQYQPAQVLPPQSTFCQLSPVPVLALIRPSLPPKTLKKPRNAPSCPQKTHPSPSSRRAAIPFAAPRDSACDVLHPGVEKRITHQPKHAYLIEFQTLERITGTLNSWEPPPSNPLK